MPCGRRCGGCSGRVRRHLAVALACAGVCWGADPLERVAAAPAEIGSWLLLKEAERVDRVPAKEERIRLVEEAYRLAGQAQLPYPLAPATGDARSDTVAGQRVEASRQHLDALSLRVRAVLAMMNLDPARAREMTLDMPVPAPARVSCKDGLIGRVDEYYGLALQMAQRGFPAKDRAEGRPQEFLRRVIAASTSPEQLVGAAQMVAQFRGSAEDRAALAASLGAALMAAPAEARAFAAVPELADAVRAVTGLDDAYAAFVKTQTEQPCADPAVVDELWSDGAAKELHTAVGGLQGERGDDWAARYAAVLHRVESFRAVQGEDRLAFFERKAGLYRAMLDLGPADGLLLRNVLASFAGFLRDSEEKTEHPAEWLAQFRRLLLPLAPAGLAGVEIAREEIERGGDAVMSLLAEPQVPLS